MLDLNLHVPACEEGGLVGLRPPRDEAIHELVSLRLLLGSVDHGVVLQLLHEGQQGVVRSLRMGSRDPVPAERAAPHESGAGIAEGVTTAENERNKLRAERSIADGALFFLH